MILDPEQTRLFWWTARERQQILLNRRAGMPRDQWTSDPVMRSHHFCNVFRCDDRVSLAVLRLAERWGDSWCAALVGRLINRYETLTALSLGEAPSPNEFRQFAQVFGLNTNAYRLNTPLGLNNLEGLVAMYRDGRELGEAVQAQRNVPDALAVMGQVKRLGGFTGYQIGLDLIEVGFFGSDFVDDWAWPGPGAGRGVARLLGHVISGSWEERRLACWGQKKENLDLQHEVMTLLLQQAQDDCNWPHEWRAWTIHEVEGWLCEYDKWARRHFNESAGGRKYKGQYGIDYQPNKQRSAA